MHLFEIHANTAAGRKKAKTQQSPEQLPPSAQPESVSRIPIRRKEPHQQPDTAQLSTPAQQALQQPPPRINNIACSVSTNSVTPRLPVSSIIGCTASLRVESVQIHKECWKTVPPASSCSYLMQIRALKLSSMKCLGFFKDLQELSLTSCFGRSHNFLIEAQGKLVWLELNSIIYVRSPGWQHDF